MSVRRSGAHSSPQHGAHSILLIRKDTSTYIKLANFSQSQNTTSDSHERLGSGRRCCLWAAHHPPAPAHPGRLAHGACPSFSPSKSWLWPVVMAFLEMEILLKQQGKDSLSVCPPLSPPGGLSSTPGCLSFSHPSIPFQHHFFAPQAQVPWETRRSLV